MIARLAIATVLTTALLGVSTPAMKAASAERTDRSLERQFASLERDLDRLAAGNDPTEDGAARLVQSVSLPSESIVHGPVDAVRFSNHESGGHVTWSVSGGKTGSRAVAEQRFQLSAESLVLRSPGPHWLAFELRTGHDGPRISIRRLRPRARHRSDGA